MGRPRLSKGFGVNILTASATVGFRVKVLAARFVEVLAALEFPLKRRSMVSVNTEWSSPNRPESGVDHDDIRSGLRTIDDGRIKLYGMRLWRGRFETALLGVLLLSSRIREGLMNKEVPTHYELWGFP